MIRVIVLTIWLLGAAALANPAEYKIGILAHRGKDLCFAKWEPLTEYLSSKIPGAEFVVVPLDFDEIDSAVEQKKIDFLLANPAMIARIEGNYDTRLLATLERKDRNGRSFDVFGTVIFCRETDDSITGLTSLKSRSFMAVDENSFGGWLIAKDLLLKNHIDPNRDLKPLLFGKTHDAVIMAVRDGKADVGCVRTGILEDLDAGGKIRLQDFKIINRINYPDSVFSQLCSSPLYPEWGLSEITRRGIGQSISLALIQMPENIAGRIGRWTIPHSYAQVAELLSYHSYANQSQIRVAQIWRKYKVVIVLFLSVLLLLLILLFYMKRSKSLLIRFSDKLLEQIDELNLMTYRLNESETQSRLLFDNAIAGIGVHELITDDSGRAVDYVFLRVNPAFERQSGFKGESVIGKKATEVMSPADAEPFIRMYGEVVLFGTPLSCERHVDSLGKWFRIYAYKTAGMQFCVLFYDITELKKQEDDLAVSHEQYRLAVTGSKDGIWDWNIRNNTLFLSPQFKGMIGYQADELLDTIDAVKELLHPDDRDATIDFVSRYLRNEVNYFRLEFRLRHKDGSYVWILSRGEALRDDHGIPYRIAGSHSDITFRKEAEKQMNAIYENIPMMIMLLDKNRRIWKANKYAEEIIGGIDNYIGTLPGESLNCIYAAENGCNLGPHCAECAVHLAVTDTLRTGRNHNQIETTLHLFDSKENKTVEMEILFSSIAINTNDEVMALICILDITDRKHAELKLNNAIAHLKKTNQKLKEQTSLARKMAEIAKIADKAKSDFLSAMSHELRTPMNGIVGMTSLLADSSLSGQQRQYIAMLQSSSKTLLTLINDILDFSKLNEKKLHLENIDFNFTEMVESTVDCLGIEAHKKGLELTCLIDPEIPTCLRGDPFRIQQVLNNLTVNAIKFTESGEIAISIGAVGEENDGITLYITVRDTGIGISPEGIDQLFQPFNQCDSSISRKFGGTGLGLAICRQLVELMHGEIGCESIEARGSTFWFTIKLEKAQNLDSFVPETFHDLNSMKVLIAAHNPTIVNQLTTLLSIWNCRTAEACDREMMFSLLDKAIDIEEPFEIIIIDESISAFGEHEFLEKLRKHPDSVRPRLVKMIYSQETASVVPPLWDGYLVKPIKQSLLNRSMLSIKAESFWAERQRDMARTIVTDNTAVRNEPVRVLLAEDDETNQAVAVGMLSRWGCQVDIAANGQEAINLIDTIPYELVFMDCQMPVMDGFEATRQLRREEQNSGRKHITIIAMTASALKGDRERCLAAGMDDYIAKPVNINELKNKLESWVPGIASPEEANVQVPGSNLDSEEIFCESEFLARLMNDRGLAQTVLTGFMSDIPQQIARLKDYIANDEMLKARHQSHTIKGASANVGAHRLRKKAEELETLIKENDYSEMINVMSSLMLEFDSLKKELVVRHWA